MEDTKVSIETAELALNAGFDRFEVQQPIMLHNEDGTSTEHYPGVTQSLLQKWLRDIHNLHIMLYLINKKYWCNLRNIENEDEILFISDLNYNSYEKALEAGLQEALKLVKK
jgi:hypothetical protein